MVEASALGNYDDDEVAVVLLQCQMLLRWDHSSEISIMLFAVIAVLLCLYNLTFFQEQLLAGCSTHNLRVPVNSF